jgi:hypothetical protein
MIPTILILVVFAVLLFALIYSLVNLSQTRVDSITKRITQEEFLWGEGYAFVALKVDADDYENLPHIREQTLEDFHGLDEFSAVVCTREHGAYHSRKVTKVSRRDRKIVCTITFGEALGPTVVEHFVVLQGGRIISAGFDPSQPYPIQLLKGDEFTIRQTIDLEDENEGSKGI